MPETIKNLYFKSWFLLPEQIEEILLSIDVTWKRISNEHFAFYVTPETIQ